MEILEFDSKHFNSMRFQPCAHTHARAHTGHTNTRPSRFSNAFSIALARTSSTHCLSRQVCSRGPKRYLRSKTCPFGWQMKCPSCLLGRNSVAIECSRTPLSRADVQICFQSRRFAISLRSRELNARGSAPQINTTTFNDG